MHPETLRFVVCGAPMRAHLSNAEVVAILGDAGIPPPAIPAGSNTVRSHITLPGGEHALVSVQRGFSPRASDDEREINGALLLVLEDAEWGADDARKILESALAQILA